MTQVKLKGLEETDKDYNLEVGDVFICRNRLYMVVDVENQDNNEYNFDLIDLQTGSGLFRNDLNVRREEYFGIEDFKEDLENHEKIKIIKQLEISIF